jgi:hypothetical protein
VSVDGRYLADEDEAEDSSRSFIIVAKIRHRRIKLERKTPGPNNRLNFLQGTT